MHRFLLTVAAASYSGDRVACSELRRGDPFGHPSRGEPHRKRCILLLRRWLERAGPLRVRLSAPKGRRLARSPGGTPRGISDASSRGSS
jgi:hypothetical protein